MQSPNSQHSNLKLDLKKSAKSNFEQILSSNSEISASNIRASIYYWIVVKLTVIVSKPECRIELMHKAISRQVLTARLSFYHHHDHLK